MHKIALRTFASTLWDRQIQAEIYFSITDIFKLDDRDDLFLLG